MINQHKKAAKNRVLVLSTGGTLGMRPTGGGPLQPYKILQDLLTWIPELQDYAEIQVEVLADLDSSLITPSLWLELAGRIRKAHLNDQPSGIVILHGTDTLAYTASSLSFLLPDLAIPVVLTGGQRPLAVTRTDARNNILGAVESALEGPVEVMVFFNNSAFRGNRATKIAIGDFDGFGSPNFPPLGKAGIFWEWNPDLFWPRTRRPTIWPDLPESLPQPPWILPWVPGLSFDDFAPALASQWAVILEAFGTGNIPVNPKLLHELQNYIERGGLVFVKSQVPRGRVALDAYAPGSAFKDMGILGGGDMTREAMVTKLMVLKGLGLANSKITSHMAQSLAGELSPQT